MKIKSKTPVMGYRQYRQARKLVHECCNYDNGNCIALDDGEECICVQSISLKFKKRMENPKENQRIFEGV